MLDGELHPHPAPDFVQVATLHVRVRPGEVDELEDAQRRARLREAHGPRRAPRLEDHDLARLDVPDVLGADDVEPGGLRGQAPACAAVLVAPQAAVRDVRGVAAVRWQPSQDERTEPERISDADHPALVEDDEAVRPADARQDPDECVDRVGRGLVGEERGQQLRIGRGREAPPAAAQRRQQLAGVDEVAVVPDGDRPARAEPERRLGVLPDRRAGRRVAAMGDRQVAAERGDPPLVED